MHYYSTRNKNEKAGFTKAALTGLAPDGGLYVPEEIPRFSATVKPSLGTMAYAEIALETIKPWVIGDVPPGILGEMIHDAYPFEVPLAAAADRLVLELFHGPTAAFKDFGARFMARVFSYLRRGEDRPLTILTATSGDTGGAVADGFFGIEGITVYVLYPKGRISELQEKQIAGLGENIRALAVEGSFDDCQRLVKEAFNDRELGRRLALASANSINVARLIPQIVYYAAAAGKIFSGVAGAVTSRGAALPAVFSVPSGNFGNLTAGLYALEMGAPIKKFIAATNINRTVPDYLEKGFYEARISEATISNAMDVGAPSNFERMSARFSLERMRDLITGVWVSDEETRGIIREVFAGGYCLDPHTAVGWKAADKLIEKGVLKTEGLAVVATAHPAKFAEVLEPLVGPVSLPLSLKNVMERKIRNRIIPAEYGALKDSL